MSTFGCTYSFKVKSEPVAVPILLPLPLILGQLFPFHASPVVQTLPCSKDHVCLVSAAFAPPWRRITSPCRFTSMSNAPRMLPMPMAAFSLPQQENAVLGSAGCFPRDAGCVASPAEGWCLCCLTTSWLCSAKSGVGMKKRDKTHQLGPGSQELLSPIPAELSHPALLPRLLWSLYEDSSSSLLCWDGGRWDI